MKTSLIHILGYGQLEMTHFQFLIVFLKRLSMESSASRPLIRHKKSISMIFTKWAIFNCHYFTAWFQGSDKNVLIETKAKSYNACKLLPFILEAIRSTHSAFCCPNVMFKGFSRSNLKENGNGRNVLGRRGYFVISRLSTSRQLFATTVFPSGISVFEISDGTWYFDYWWFLCLHP